MPVRMVMLPPMANPKVTAGFKWPPEMLAAMATPTNSAKACATATATRPAGSNAASAVSLPTNPQLITPLSYIRLIPSPLARIIP